MAKMGRPQKDDKKSNAIGIRLSKEMNLEVYLWITLQLRKLLKHIYLKKMI